ncbi:MAG: squalene/phytoene synthase family protein [Alphaproteobacteria bacterium]|nr:squalene/phytoene synthase family protein [Alphaproteobacteria bacterium]
MSGPATVDFDEACRVLVARHDRERYLPGLFAPADRRSAWFAVLAANHEIAKTAEVVSEPAIGHIRLQWWRESLDGIEAGSPRRHEVVTPLAEAVGRGLLDLEALRAVIDAREIDLDPDPVADLDALVAYAEGAGGSLHGALARVLGADEGSARLVGTAWALLGLVRALPVLIAHGRSPLPHSLLQKNNLSNQKITDKPGSVSLSPVVRPVIERAKIQMHQARDTPGFRAANARPLRLLADRAGDVVRTIEAVGCEPFDPRLAVIPPGLIWRHARRWLGYRLGL